MPLPRPLSHIRRWTWKRWLLAYLVLLALSHAVIAVFSPNLYLPAGPLASGERFEVVVPEMSDDGPIAGSSARLTGIRWEAAPHAGDRPPVILLHGSPSTGARDYSNLGPWLADRGYDAVALDRPGFGDSERWVASYSIIANARYALAVMDELAIDRAHLVGWSLSGGVVLHMAAMDPDRAATLTLQAAIGIQEAEGSGSYYFEHAKYALGYGLLVVLPELLPHFGLLPPRHFLHAFIRDFWDTDQRPLRAIMERLEVPTLVLHGRHDRLIPAWAAEAHHEIIGPSRLVMLDANHFFPFGGYMSDREAFEQGAEHLLAFLRRHDEPGVPPLRQAAIFEPGNETDSAIGGFDIKRRTPWWLVILIIIAATFISEDLTVIAVGLLISHQQIDLGVGLIGCFMGIILGDFGLWAIGRFLGRRVLGWPVIRRRISEASLQKWGRVIDQHTGKAVLISRCLPGTRLPTYLAAGILARKSRLFLMWVSVAVFLWTPFLLILAMLIGPPLRAFFEQVLHGPYAILASFLVLYVIVRLIGYETTELGRQKLAADLRRIVLVEFWPPWLFYMPLAPYLLWLSLRYRPMTFTCVNPAISHGGGIVGESKHKILSGFGDDVPELLPWRLVERDGSPAERAERAIEAIREDERLGGYPVVLKPDSGERGYGLKIARSDDDVRAYFDSYDLDVIVQRYADEPHELGVLWTRVPEPGKRAAELDGEIFSVTRKEFPVLVGDGEHTLEHLVWHHPRYRMQAKVFLQRFAGRTDWVPEAGEVVPLATAGNHAQGTMFLDAREVITPELSARVEEIARSFGRDQDADGLDFGRLDIRYRDEQEVRRGRGFWIVELNGALSESTNLYEPNRPIWWRYGILFRQWRRLYRLGAIRRREGVRPVTFRGFGSMLLRYYRNRPRLGVSD